MTMSPQMLRTAIETACSEVRIRIQEKILAYEQQLKRAKDGGEGPPKDDRPNVSAYWMDWVADELANQSLPKWFRDEDLVAGAEDIAGPVLAQLLELPEFGLLAGVAFDIRWSPAAAVRKDVVATEHKAGKIKVVSKADRLTWPGDGPAPDFRLELSLPFFLLATSTEAERGLHELLAHCAYKDDEPCLKKADIHAFSSTLGRYGVSTPREAQAVIHAQRHPDHSSLCQRFGFDPTSGQGYLWGPPERAGSVIQLHKEQRPSPKLVPEPEA